MKASRSRKTPPAYDPRELEDLIMNPAVGKGVGSHLINANLAPLLSITEPSNLSTVDMSNAEAAAPPSPQSDLSTVDRFNSEPLLHAPAGRFWLTESGELVPYARVRAISSLDEVLNEAEQAVYAALRSQGIETVEGDRLAEMGYDPLCRQTGLSRKTIQRVIFKLVLKDAMAIDRPADIYTRRPTRYRIFSPDAALTRMAGHGRTHVAKIGPGFVFARPGPEPASAVDSTRTRAVQSDLSTVDRFNMSTVDRSKLRH